MVSTIWHRVAAWQHAFIYIASVRHFEEARKKNGGEIVLMRRFLLDYEEIVTFLEVRMFIKNDLLIKIHILAIVTAY